MINIRRLVISALGAVLLAAPLIRSQDTQWLETKPIVTQPLTIQVSRCSPSALSTVGFP